VLRPAAPLSSAAGSSSTRAGTGAGFVVVDLPGSAERFESLELPQAARVTASVSATLATITPR